MGSTDADGLPWSEVDPDKVEFAEHSITGTVHVVVHAAHRGAWWRRYRARGINAELWPEENANALAVIFRPIPTVCGALLTRSTGDYIDGFNDARLCRSCHRVTPKARRPLLFMHPVPGVTDLDEID